MPDEVGARLSAAGRLRSPFSRAAQAAIPVPEEPPKVEALHFQLS